MVALAQSIEASETPIDRLLRRQQTLDTPVARFSREHDTPDLAPHYSQLIPLSAPQAGEQYAFEVDLDRCTGCKACVSACHSLNGLEAHETWRDVGLIHGGSVQAPYQQTVTTACHHCEDPACANGCPVLAYEKDPVTGIVLHLDDQCIGCQYCILKCPYDVPKYSKQKGIVRKCDMCHSRLSEGEAPACVQACPTEAIRITTISTSRVVNEATQNQRIIPGAFPSDYTKPTTRYVSQKAIPENASEADASALRPQHAHWPLIWLLIFTQISVGFIGAALVVGEGLRTIALGLSGLTCLIGLAASVAHLGKPLKAWRVFLGLRRSWLSREAVVFGIYAKLLLASAVCHVVTPLHFLQMPVMVASFAVGVLGVFTSVMIYHDTRRAYWNIALSGPKFFLTTLIACSLLLSAIGWSAMGIVSAVLILAKLVWESQFLKQHVADSTSAHYKTARVVCEIEESALKIRQRAAFGAIVLSIAATGLGALPASLALACWLVSDIAERYLFFVAVDAPKMPGTYKP